MMEVLQDVSWPCLVGLFLTSLLIVLTWLVQYLLTALRLRRAKQLDKQRTADTAHQQHHPLIPCHRQTNAGAGGVWGFLLKLRSGSDGGGSVSEAGVKGLLASLFSFKSFREHWQRAWVRALNEQACRHGSSIQITFDSSLQLNSSAEIDSVTCTNQSVQSMVLHCKCKVDTMTFPVTVTQQSPAAVSMDTYQITLEPMVATVVVCLEEVEEEGMLVSWTLSKQPTFNLTVCPRRIQRKGSDGEVDLDMIRELVEDTLFSTQPAMVLNLTTCVSSPAVPTEHLPVVLCPPSQGTSVQQLLLRQIKATFHKGGQLSKPVELCCVLSLNQPSAESRTHFLSLPSDPPCSLEWSEDITLDVGPETKEMRVRLLERNATRERYLPGYASITLDLSCTIPSRQHVLSVSPGHGLAPSATVTLEILCVESGEPDRCHNDVPLRSSHTPTKKVDVDRTIMPDGTIVTTVTTIHSRPKLNRSAGDSPKRSPSKVEVTENTHTMPSDGRSSTSSLSSNSLLSNGLDPVADTAIRQLTESANKVSTGSGRKTPTRRSTLIISGVSKVPLAEDDCALSVGYAAAMDAELHGNHYGAGHHQRDPDETTPSDASERPSVDDVESDTGSTGAMETRSLKDHKVGFLRSGTKLLFRRRHREKEPCVSVSHEDISNLSNNCVPSATSSRKKSGSFSRRLIKRFSFRSSGKSKGKATTTNGGESTLDN